MIGGAFGTIDEALLYLDAVGTTDDSEIDLFEAALALSAQSHPNISYDKYRNHRRKLVEDVESLHVEYLNLGNPDDVHAKIHALAAGFTRANGYIGDDFRYNDLQNADLMRVIDRRLGLPIALAILCVTIGRDLGWPITGINFPAHFVIRLEQGGVREIVDPFQGCIVLKAPDLREILKKTMGPQAELSAAYYEPATNRDTLVRLQNNIKLRQIEAEDYEGALATVDLIRRIAPDEFRLDLDAGVLLARLERPLAAIESLERYIAHVTNARDKHDAVALLQQLRTHLQ